MESDEFTELTGTMKTDCSEIQLDRLITVAQTLKRPPVDENLSPPQAPPMREAEMVRRAENRRNSMAGSSISEVESEPGEHERGGYKGYGLGWHEQ